MAPDLLLLCSSVGVDRRHLSLSDGTLAEPGGILAERQPLGSWRRIGRLRLIGPGRGHVQVDQTNERSGQRADRALYGPGDGSSTVIRVRGSSGRDADGSVGSFTSLRSSVRSDERRRSETTTYKTSALVKFGRTVAARALRSPSVLERLSDVPAAAQ